MQTRLVVRTMAGVGMLMLLAGACSPKPKAAKQADLQEAARATLTDMEQLDPSLRERIAKAEGMVLFPEVGKGAFVVGGAYGRGVVYERGKMIGYADLTSATVGLQAGGQSYDELILFENAAPLDEFRRGQLRFTANMSAVALTSGVAATTPYQNGVAVFVRPRGGLMAEAAVGGQSFRFVPLEEAQQ